MSEPGSKEWAAEESRLYKKGKFRCHFCRKAVSMSDGAADDMPDGCSDCWKLYHKHDSKAPVARGGSDAPIPMLLHCPLCSARHIDEGAFATKVHHMHACQECGHVWRPAVVATVGVRFLPGFKNEAIS